MVNLTMADYGDDRRGRLLKVRSETLGEYIRTVVHCGAVRWLFFFRPEAIRSQGSVSRLRFPPIPQSLKSSLAPCRFGFHYSSKSHRLYHHLTAYLVFLVIISIFHFFLTIITNCKYQSLLKDIILYANKINLKLN